MAMVNLFGMMEENIKVSGERESNMELENIYYLMERKEQENGLMEKESDGQNLILNKHEATFILLLIFLNAQQSIKGKKN